MDAAEGTRRDALSHQRLDRHLIAGLVRAIDWLDNSLQNLRVARGYPSMHRTQSLILVHIASGIDAPADIAREMGSTRQNIHHMTRGLIDLGIVEQYPDPHDPRRARYRVSEGASELRDYAISMLEALERLIALRAGVSPSDMKALRRVLTADWGPEVRDPSELEAFLGRGA
jgi:DNA-binding MarR family transcriptional regulator